MPPHPCQFIIQLDKKTATADSLRRTEMIMKRKPAPDVSWPEACIDHLCKAADRLFAEQPDDPL
jgi:hypothetical protein